jgi:hypothetical protein
MKPYIKNFHENAIIEICPHIIAVSSLGSFEKYRTHIERNTEEKTKTNYQDIGEKTKCGGNKKSFII